MKKKILGVVVSCLSVALCFFIGLGMTVVSADDGDGNKPTPRVCSHPWCWGA